MLLLVRGRRRINNILGLQALDPYPGSGVYRVDENTFVTLVFRHPDGVRGNRATHTSTHLLPWHGKNRSPGRNHSILLT
jgi:hypothetical protein